MIWSIFEHKTATTLLLKLRQTFKTGGSLRLSAGAKPHRFFTITQSAAQAGNAIIATLAKL
jgi:hypothetical protein